MKFAPIGNAIAIAASLTVIGVCTLGSARGEARSTSALVAWVEGVAATSVYRSQVQAGFERLTGNGDGIRIIAAQSLPTRTRLRLQRAYSRCEGKQACLQKVFKKAQIDGVVIVQVAQQAKLFDGGQARITAVRHHKGKMIVQEQPIRWQRAELDDTLYKVLREILAVQHSRPPVAMTQAALPVIPLEQIPGQGPRPQGQDQPPQETIFIQAPKNDAPTRASGPYVFADAPKAKIQEADVQGEIRTTTHLKPATYSTLDWGRIVGGTALLVGGAGMGAYGIKEYVAAKQAAEKQIFQVDLQAQQADIDAKLDRARLLGAVGTAAAGIGMAVWIWHLLDDDVPQKSSQQRATKTTIGLMPTADGIMVHAQIGFLP